MHVKPVGVSTHCPEFKHGWFPHEVSVDSHVGPTKHKWLDLQLANKPNAPQYLNGSNS